jgi:DNA-directed RNA polymerase subunit RPC12/RpoP
MENREIFCESCSFQIDSSLDPFLEKGTEPIPCPKCGCRKRIVNLLFTEAINSPIDDSSIKGTIRKSTGGKKEIFSGKYGTEFHHDTKTWQERDRTIKKLDDTYYKQIKNTTLIFFQVVKKNYQIIMDTEVPKEIVYPDNQCF